MGDSVSVLVTGSAGRVGSAACKGLLARGHKVRGFDIRESTGIEDAIVGDLSERSDIDGAMRGIEVLVHLAATPENEDFMSKLLPNNIIGLHNVLESARLAGVRRIILASTGQVVEGHTDPWPITPQMPVSPRNWYASAKIMAEAVGQLYAYVHGISVIVARLGWCPRDKPHADALSRDEFGQDVYFSPGDVGRFFACAVECKEDLDYCVVFATSRPVRKSRYDMTAARDLLGYEPLDTWPEGTELVTE